MKNPVRTISLIFIMLMVIRLFEFFVLRTDQSVLDENLFHKLAGILALFIILGMLGLAWRDIGFKKGKLLQGLVIGAVLFVVTYSIAYAAEFLILRSRGVDASIELYASGFKMSGTTVRNAGILFLLYTLFVNLINSWMEEGVFRGLFIRLSIGRFGFNRANVIQAAFFALWHIVVPAREYVDGTMGLQTALTMAFGYAVLSFMMGFKLGMLVGYSGAIWAGFFEHTFNNTVVNLLHVVSSSGVDDLQIVRVMIAQVLSFVLVLCYGVIVKKRDRKSA